MRETRSICLAQIGYDSQDVGRHIERIQEIVRRNRDHDLIVLPELIVHGHPSVEKSETFLYRKARAGYGMVSARLYRFIREIGARVIFGEIKRRGDRWYNVATYVDPERTQQYTKCHVHWTEKFCAGKRLRTFDTPIGKVGINICYDAAFSEVWRTLALRGARVIVNISAVPTDFPIDYMHRRMQGAALNNQVFVVYVNRPAPQFSGHSALFDPRGEIVARAGAEPEVLSVPIDLEEVEVWRHREQILGRRRPQLYRSIVNGALPARFRVYEEPADAREQRPQQVAS